MSVVKVELEDDSDDNDVNEKKTCKKSRISKQWFKIKEFQCALEAATFIESQKLKKVTRYRSHEGERVNYRCSKGRYRFSECPVEFYCLYHACSSKVSLYKTNEEHANHTDGHRGLKLSVRETIIQMYDEGITKPNAIIAAFQRRNLQSPPKIQLNNFLASLRTKMYSPIKISTGQLQEWCQRKSVIPDKDNEVFVLDHNIHPDNSQDIKFVISTKRLLQLANKSDVIQIDTKYKLTWQGYPVLIIGNSDQQRVFHPYAIAICTEEKATDFKFIFHSIKNTFEYLFNKEWNPKILLADASDAITEGFQMVFGAPHRRLVCYGHVLKDIEARLKSMDGVKRFILNDIQQLHLCRNDEIFDVACSLFKNKWQSQCKTDINEFIEYFDTVWLTDNRYWYEGACTHSPSTNNGLESINAQIRNEHTLRERLPVCQFLKILESTILKKLTLDRDPEISNHIGFITKPVISLELWTETYQWLQSNPKIYREDNPNETFFYIVSSKDPTINLNKEYVQKYRAMYLKWTSFDEFVNYAILMWELKCLKKVEDSVVTCTCPTFTKQNICKHSVGILIVMGGYVVSL